MQQFTCTAIPTEANYDAGDEQQTKNVSLIIATVFRRFAFNKH